MCLLGVVTITIFFCAVSVVNQAKVDEHVPFSGKELDVETVKLQDNVKHGVLLYPSELYYGDSLYLLAYRINEGGKIRVFENERDSSFAGFHDITISSKKLETKYKWRFELQNNLRCDIAYAYVPGPFESGERKTGFSAIIDSPPLEDWNDPFWKELREKMTPEGIRCTISFKYDTFLAGKLDDISVSQEVVVKPRPNEELTLLEKWYEKTPKESFPVRRGKYKVPIEDFITHSSGSSIKVGDKKFSPWRWIRAGNRKPSDPNNPTTLEGWRNLESQLSPSTMRDEIRLTRLLLEFYSANEEESSEYWKSELMNWLSTLPESQRTVYVGRACRVVVDMMQTQKEWETKSLKLFAPLYEIAGDGTKLVYEFFYREVMKPSR